MASAHIWIFLILHLVSSGATTEGRRGGSSTTTESYKRAGPTLGKPPLDVNGELETVFGIITQLSDGVTGLVAGLTGISVKNCASQIKGDLNKMTCPQFIQQLSKCESLMGVKGLLQAAKKKYQKNPNSKKPCFQ